MAPWPPRVGGAATAGPSLNRRRRGSSRGSTITWSGAFLPVRTFTGPADFNTKLQAWPDLVNQRRRRALGCATVDRVAADTRGDAAVTAGAAGYRVMVLDRCPGGFYVRLDGNDYSVHPSVIGRRVQVNADLDRVQAFGDGRLAVPGSDITTSEVAPNDRPLGLRRRKL